MQNKPKTHYRKVFKSDHLGSADLEDMIEAGTQLIFTIAHVKQEYGVMVAGRKGNHNIAYFKEKIKPLVLNATNSKIVKKFCKGSSFVEDWKDVRIQIYIDTNVKMKGETVSGVRINPQQPRASRPTVSKDNGNTWANAKNAYKRDGNFHAVSEKADISKESMDLIIFECDEEANA